MTVQTRCSSTVSLASDCLGRGARFSSATKLKSQMLHPPGSPPSSLFPNIFTRGPHFSAVHTHSRKTYFPFLVSETSLFKTERQNFAAGVDEGGGMKMGRLSRFLLYFSPLDCDFVLKGKETLILFALVLVWGS